MFMLSSNTTSKYAFIMRMVNMFEKKTYCVLGVDKYVTEVEYIFPCMRGFWRAGYKGIHSVPSYQALQMHIKVTYTSV